MAYWENKEMQFVSENRNVIQVFNDGSEIIPGFTAITVSKIRESGGIQLLCAAPAVSDDGIWGVAAADIIPGTWGSMVLNGAVKAFISGGSGNYAVPSGNGTLAAAASGRAQIVYRSTPELPGLILLGAGSGGEEEYTGQFAVRHLENRTFEITSPRQQPLEYAGRTDLPEAQEVPVQTVTLPANMDDGELRFYACFKENAYSAVIQFSELPLPEGWFDRFLLAHVYASGRVTQYYKSYTDYSFGSRWFL